MELIDVGGTPLEGHCSSSDTRRSMLARQVWRRREVDGLQDDLRDTVSEAQGWSQDGG